LSKVGCQRGGGHGGGRQGEGRGGSQGQGCSGCVGGGWCGSGCRSGGRSNRVSVWSKLSNNDPQAIARDGHQDDGCQDNPRAVALGEVGDHAGMITSVWRMGKPKGLWTRGKKEISVAKFWFSLRSSCLCGYRVLRKHLNQDLVILEQFDPGKFMDLCKKQ
jgi:hypothetical protein